MPSESAFKVAFAARAVLTACEASASRSRPIRMSFWAAPMWGRILSPTRPQPTLVEFSQLSVGRELLRGGRQCQPMRWATGDDASELAALSGAAVVYKSDWLGDGRQSARLFLCKRVSLQASFYQRPRRQSQWLLLLLFRPA